MAVENWVAKHVESLTAFRRDLHQNPELLYDVTRTAATVADALRTAGVDEVVEGIGRTGVVGVIHGQTNTSGRTIGTPAATTATPPCCWVQPASWRKAVPLTAPSSSFSNLPRKAVRAPRQ